MPLCKHQIVTKTFGSVDIGWLVYLYLCEKCGEKDWAYERSGDGGDGGALVPIQPTQDPAVSEAERDAETLRKMEEGIEVARRVLGYAAAVNEVSTIE